MLERERSRAEPEVIPPLSPSTSVSEQVRAFPGHDLFANLRDGLNSESPCLRGESCILECRLGGGGWQC